MTSSRHPPFGVFRNRKFLLFFSARLSSQSGDKIAPVALAFAVLYLGYGSRGLGIVLATQSTTLILMLLIGGVIADRHTPRRVMVVADVIRFASQGMLAISLTGHPSLLYIASLQAITSVGTSLFNPAIAGLLPRLVSGEELRPANAVLSLVQSASVFVGPALGGVLAATVGPQWAIGVNAATFGVSGIFISLLPAQVHRVSRSSPWRELMDGWRAVKERRWLWSGILLFSFQNLLIVGPLEVLGPALAGKSLGGPTSWGLIVSSLGLGAIVGALVMMRLHAPRPLLTAIGLMFGVVPELIAFANGWGLAVVVSAAFIGGVCLAAGSVLWDVAMQTAIPMDTLSRVSAFDYFGTLLLQPVGFALAGPVADRFGAGREMLLGAVAFSIATASVLAVAEIRSFKTAQVYATAGG